MSRPARRCARSPVTTRRCVCARLLARRTAHRLGQPRSPGQAVGHRHRHGDPHDPAGAAGAGRADLAGSRPHPSTSAATGAATTTSADRDRLLGDRRGHPGRDHRLLTVRLRRRDRRAGLRAPAPAHLSRRRRGLLRRSQGAGRGIGRRAARLGHRHRRRTAGRQEGRRADRHRRIHRRHARDRRGHGWQARSGIWPPANGPGAPRRTPWRSPASPSRPTAPVR